MADPPTTKKEVPPRFTFNGKVNLKINVPQIVLKKFDLMTL